MFRSYCLKLKQVFTFQTKQTTPNRLQYLILNAWIKLPCNYNCIKLLPKKTANALHNCKIILIRRETSVNVYFSHLFLCLVMCAEISFGTKRVSCTAPGPSAAPLRATSVSKRRFIPNVLSCLINKLFCPAWGQKP